jgi:pimeloyl-ACP methyl ester carboxylesterase
VPSDDDEGADDGVQPRLAARSGGGVVYASADARQGAPKKAKVAAMEGRTIYRRRDGRARPRNPLANLADFFLAPFPPDVRVRVRRAAKDFQAALDALLQRLEQFTLPDPEPDLARVTAPALLLWGAADVMVPAAHAARFEAAMPDARVVILEDAGHMPMEEAPEDSLMVVRNFLAGLGEGQLD